MMTNGKIVDNVALVGKVAYDIGMVESDVDSG